MTRLAQNGFVRIVAASVVAAAFALGGFMLGGVQRAEVSSAVAEARLDAIGLRMDKGFNRIDKRLDRLEGQVLFALREYGPGDVAPAAGRGQ